MNAALHLDRLHEALQGVLGVRIVFPPAVGVILGFREDLRERDLLDAHLWAFQLETLAGCFCCPAVCGCCAPRFEPWANPPPRLRFWALVP